MRLKFKLIVCYFKVEYLFNLTNLLNYVVPFVELMMQMWAI